MFSILIYPSSGACDCAAELPNLSFCSRFVVCWSLVRLGLSNIHVTGFNLQHGHYDRFGNSTAQSQAPDDGYINFQNILST